MKFLSYNFKREIFRCVFSRNWSNVSVQKWSASYDSSTISKYKLNAKGRCSPLIRERHNSMASLTGSDLTGFFRLVSLFCSLFLAVGMVVESSGKVWRCSNPPIFFNTKFWKEIVLKLVLVLPFTTTLY